MGKLKIYKIISGVLSVFSCLSTGLTIYSLYLLSKIETFYRIMFSLLLILATVTVVYSLLESIKFFKKKKFIISSAFSVVLVVITTIISLIILQLYGKLDKMNKNELTYKTALISFEQQDKIEKLKGKKIGLVETEDDIAGYILPNELIEKYKLKDNNEIKSYTDTITLMTALVNNEVDMIFISSNYKSMYNKIEGVDKTKQIYEITTYEKTYKKSEVHDEDVTSTAKVTEPFTMLLLGVDDDSESFNADTIMLITFDPSTLHATMFSIPRDTYVTVCSGAQTKITHSGWSGAKCVVKTVENFTGINVDYYVKINFKGVVDLVNALNGITVDVPLDFCESNSDRLQGEGYDICLNKGVQRLDGEQALALARHRKTLPLGDFQRGQNQQLVVEGMVNELKNIKSPKEFYNILDIIGDNMDTSMSTDDILSFYNVGKNILLKDEDATLNITKTFLTGYDLYVWEGYSSYTFQYYKQSLDEIIKAMKINLGQIEQEEIKTFSFNINEPYEKEIIGYKYYTSEPRKQLIPNFSNFSLSDAQGWAGRNNFSLSINYIETSDNSYYNGQIVGQSVHEGVLIEKASRNITIYVIKIVENGSGNTTEGSDPKDPVVPGVPIDPDEPEKPDKPEKPDPDDENENNNPSDGDEEKPPVDPGDSGDGEDENSENITVD